MNMKELIEELAGIFIMDENGKLILLKQVIIEHFNNKEDVEEYLTSVFKFNKKRVEKMLEKLEEDKIIHFFGVSSDDDYVILYVVKLIN